MKTLFEMTQESCFLHFGCEIQQHRGVWLVSSFYRNDNDSLSWTITVRYFISRKQRHPLSFKILFVAIFSIMTEFVFTNFYHCEI